MGRGQSLIGVIIFCCPLRKPLHIPRERYRSIQCVYAEITVKTIITLALAIQKHSDLVTYASDALLTTSHQRLCRITVNSLWLLHSGCCNRASPSPDAGMLLEGAAQVPGNHRLLQIIVPVISGFSSAGLGRHQGHCSSAANTR